MNKKQREILRKHRRDNVLEHLRERAHLPRRRLDFFIVTAAYDAGRYVERCLESVRRQRYPGSKVTHLVIDDASRDRTGDVIARYLEDVPCEHHVQFERNSENRGGCANYTRGFRRAPKDSVVLQLDGDDWLADSRVLAYLNLLYADADLWMTYNTWRSPAGKPALFNRPLPSEVIERNAFREHPWVTSHLHTFRARLFDHVEEEHLIDPTTGEYWRKSVDQAHYLPMLELAGPRARHLVRETYVYNLHAGSLKSISREEQVDCERRIRQLPRYSALSGLE